MTYLPTGFDGIKIVSERTGDNPNLGETEFVLASDTWRPHVYTRFCSVVLFPSYISHRMLQKNSFFSFYDQSNKMSKAKFGLKKKIKLY